MIFTTILSGLISLGGSWFKGRQEIAQAKQKAIIKKIEVDGNWDEIMAKASASSWKDEYLTIIFTIPFILLFISAIFNLPTLQTRVVTAFNIIDKDIPQEYWYILGVIVAASFGVKSVIKGISTLRK